MNAPAFAPFSATHLTRRWVDMVALHHWAVPLAVDQATELASAHL